MQENFKGNGLWAVPFSYVRMNYTIAAVMMAIL